MAQDKIELTSADRKKVWWRHQFLQGSWNYERMQNGGWCYSMIPAIKKLYPAKEDQVAALKRHLEFYNTHPYVSSPVIGVTLALEEERANGAPVDDAAIQGVKVGMMGPLAGVGDPVFWFTVRPILGALGASLALGGSILGPILFFVAWNVIRMAFEWYTQEFGYKVGSSIAKDLGGGMMGKITEGASILGMFIIGALVQRWVSISFTPIVSQITQQDGSYIDWSQIQGNADGIKSALTQYSSLGATGLDQIKTTTLQGNLDQLIPGLAAVLLTLLCCKLLKKKVSPIVIILALFAVGIIGRLLGFMSDVLARHPRNRLPQQVSLGGPPPVLWAARPLWQGEAHGAVTQHKGRAHDQGHLLHGPRHLRRHDGGRPRARVLQRAQPRGLHPDSVGVHRPHRGLGHEPRQDDCPLCCLYHA